jgi:hypothetical protein
MKITPSQYAELKALIAPLAPSIPSRRAAIAKEGKAHDPEKRLRWDLSLVALKFICEKLYPSGLNDDHIDTALRSIMRELEEELK